MVGIPGKSKGCNTCRRRKVKCDEARPFCARCLNSNRTCEGYERYAVFINRSQDGIQKRHRLEEARSESPGWTKSSEVTPAVPNQVNNNAINMQAFTGYFISSLLPAGPYRSSTWSSFESYRQTFLRTTPSDVRKAVSYALAETRFGWYIGNKTIYHEGQMLYGRSLKLLQEAIEDPLQAQADDTLAAVRMMIAYESYGATTTDVTAWHNHIAGLGAMVRARGPASHTVGLSRELLIDLRQSMMIHAMMKRKRCFLAEHAWQEAARPNTLFDSPFEITNFGFEIAALLEDGDKIATSSHWSLSAAQTLLSDFSILQTRIEEFAAILIRRQGVETKCDICGDDLHAAFDEHLIMYRERTTTALGSCDFFLQISIVYGLMIAIAGPMHGLYRKIKGNTGLSREQGEQVEIWSSDARQVLLGCRILRLIEHCLHHELGMLFSRGTILPLQCARLGLMTNAAYSAKCLSLIEILCGQRHIPFAKQVNRGQEHVSYFAKKGLSQLQTVDLPISPMDEN